MSGREKALMLDRKLLGKALDSSNAKWKIQGWQEKPKSERDAFAFRVSLELGVFRMRRGEK